MNNAPDNKFWVANNYNRIPPYAGDGLATNNK